MGDSPREFRFHRRAHRARHLLVAEQVVGRNAHRILHHHPHVDDVLIAGEELREQRLGAAEHGIGQVAADHQALQLLHLELVHAVDRPGQGVVDAREHARLHHRAEARLHRLLIGRHHVHAA